MIAGDLSTRQYAGNAVHMIFSLIFKKYPVIQGINTPEFKNQDIGKIAEIHERIHSNPGLIDAFCAENPFNFNQEELDIIKSWKNFVKNEDNRAEYWDEIKQLLGKNPLLFKIYYQEIGKSNSRKVKKRLSEKKK